MGKARINGTIARVVGDKGFGFINGEDGEEYFFHMSAVDMDYGLTFKRLQKDDRVSFEIGSGPKGPRAEQIRPPE